MSELGHFAKYWESGILGPEGMHRKFWDPHIRDAVAWLELGIMTLVMHSQY